MKYILIKGSKESGKYTTISEVCKRLRPESIRRLNCQPHGRGFLEKYFSDEIVPGNYILGVRGQCILVIAGSPTEQKIQVTEIITTVQKLGVKPQVAIIAMRGRERLGNFATAHELSDLGKCIFETKIWRIPAINYKLSDEWNKRVMHLVNIVKINL